MRPYDVESAADGGPPCKDNDAIEKRQTLLYGVFLAWLTASLFLLSAAPAYAWGPEGHAIVAQIALDHLTPAARDKLQPLLGDTHLDAISSWPDQIRSALPETAPWHYVDIPSTADGYLATRDCPQDNCIVAKILWFSKILGDPKQSRSAQLLALEFLVHFVGDLHQPFHALADARGGNDIPVTVFGAQQCGAYACQLHGAWDSDLINHTGLDQYQYTAYLEEMIAGSHLEAGAEDPVQWANDSWKLAKEALVKPGANLDEPYYTMERPVIDRQLALAGLRLARLLNQDFLNQDLGGAPAVPAPASVPADTPKPK
jgi:S1/P1 Nuclease